jgi:hypothetical protein
MFMRVADYATYARQSDDFFRGTLRITTGDHDPGFRIFTMNAADGGAGVLVRGGGHGAGVENYESSVCRLTGALQTALSKLMFESSAVCLGRPASEIFHEERRHIPILA